MIVWNYLEHYGIPRKSGRYAWGSGENPYHHGQSAPWRVRRNIKKYDKLKSKLDKNQSADEKRIIDKINKIDDKLLKLHHKEIEKQKIKRGKEILDQEHTKWLMKLSINETGTISQKQYDKLYKEYSEFVKNNYKKPYVLTPEERKAYNKVWTKKQYREGIGPLPKDRKENALLISASNKVEKGNRKKRGWY